MIIERTLGNNQDLKDWQDERLKWQSEEVSDQAEYLEDKGDDFALQPQRIRLFRIIFN